MRDRSRRQPGRDVADDRDAVALQVERRADPDAEDEEDEPAGDAGREPFDTEEQRERAEADRDGREARVVEVGDEVTELAERVALALLEAEELGELADGDEDREPEDEAGDHRAGEELGDEARAARVRRRPGSSPVSRIIAAARSA